MRDPTLYLKDILEAMEAIERFVEFLLWHKIRPCMAYHKRCYSRSKILDSQNLRGF